MEFTTKIEYVISDAVTTIADIREKCLLANVNDFAAVCVPPLFIKQAKDFLSASNVRVATMIGFPYGYSAVEAKLAEILLAIVDGADELELMINLAAIKNNDWQYIAREINSIMQVTRSQDKTLKVCIEAGMLTKEEIIRCCDIYGVAGVNAIITSSGFAEHTIAEDVSLVRASVADAISVEAYCDGTYRQAKAFLENGASRIITRNVVMLLHEYASLN